MGVSESVVTRLEIDAMDATHPPEKGTVNIESGVYGEATGRLSAIHFLYRFMSFRCVIRGRTMQGTTELAIGVMSVFP